MDPIVIAAAIHAGWRVRFTTAVALGQELLQAHNEARLPKALKGWDRFDLVILDELGYLAWAPRVRCCFSCAPTAALVKPEGELPATVVVMAHQTRTLWP